MKTLDETKKGLGFCGVLDGDCENCPYDDGPQLLCVDRLRKDALAYIQQLESRLAQVERERDAAVSDLETVIGFSAIVNLDCEFCKYEDIPACEECDWQWRGVCPENSKEEDR